MGRGSNELLLGRRGETPQEFHWTDARMSEDTRRLVSEQAQKPSEELFEELSKHYARHRNAPGMRDLVERLSKRLVSDRCLHKNLGKENLTEQLTPEERELIETAAIQEMDSVLGEKRSLAGFESFRVLNHALLSGEDTPVSRYLSSRLTITDLVDTPALATQWGSKELATHTHNRLDDVVKEWMVSKAGQVYETLNLSSGSFSRFVVRDPHHSVLHLLKEPAAVNAENKAQAAWVVRGETVCSAEGEQTHDPAPVGAWERASAKGSPVRQCEDCFRDGEFLSAWCDTSSQAHFAKDHTRCQEINNAFQKLVQQLQAYSAHEEDFPHPDEITQMMCDNGEVVNTILSDLNAREENPLDEYLKKLSSDVILTDLMRHEAILFLIQGDIQGLERAAKNWQ